MIIVFLIFSQFKSLSTVGIEGYGVLIDTDTSEVSSITNEFIEVEQSEKRAVDEQLFKYMCGE